ncbi:MAG TPA: DUF4142 domain-containing protein [Mycobacteriales bacterium]|nr:DUF4142 domain-containing protein [Mycobacteriales bacterium]
MSRLTWVAGMLAWPFLVTGAAAAAPVTLPAVSPAGSGSVSLVASPEPLSTAQSTTQSTAQPTGSSTGSSTGSPTPGPTPSPTPTPSAQDLAFLRATHQDNLVEIQAGTAAEHRGGSGPARSLGTRMVRDHTRLDADLQRIATRLGLDMPTAPTPTRQRQLAQVTVNIGTAFDRAWVAAVVGWNTEALSGDQVEARSGGLDGVRGLARDAAGVVRGHLSRLADVPLDEPRMPTPLRTNTDDYAASQSPLVVSVAAGMITVGAAMLVLTARAGLARHRRG